ncbi:hypothetical protein PC9H_008927 [Pleurotus ostreatus]|nr:uncharacterized protein PC9H_008927 [Pleurotus ostreatus]KDQ26212.1 hypothetical protein PLEOSDRAFT_1107077 [Pleurotus ostreatus PC15]KAF7426558.1 hypothetical protein PC9H_008927 [Pleurotus ostreatus]KAJ8694124.1 E3 ubiquitin ligase [Pleurotus ostreatus]KAJ8694201.1 E3 ubiquitin ligase [Pleurotus ostreatus]KAJ8697373.1 E3 ubiquitin ligase [Pleurotus ostreatus]
MRPPHPYAPALDARKSSRLAKISPSSSQIPQESTTVSIDLPPPHEASSRDALKGPSLDATASLASSVKGVKKANRANLQQTRWALSKEKRRCAELDAANQELSQRMTVITATLAQALRCGICHDYMVAASTTSCGHTFCTGCLASWFRSQIRYKLDDYGYGRIFEDNAFPRNAEERRLLQRTLQEDMSFAEAKEWFAYRCPTCQGDVTKTPYEVHMMKEIMESFAVNVYPDLENSALGRAANAVEFAGLFVDGDLC